MVRECEQGIEDVYHFFFECAYYTNIINQLQTRIWHICTLAGNKGAPRWTVSLTPSSINTFSKAHCSDVLKATFEFIKHSGRCLWCRLSQLFVVCGVPSSATRCLYFESWLSTEIFTFILFVELSNYNESHKTSIQRFDFSLMIVMSDQWFHQVTDFTGVFDLFGYDSSVLTV